MEVEDKVESRGNRMGVHKQLDAMQARWVKGHCESTGKRDGTKLVTIRTKRDPHTLQW